MFMAKNTKALSVKNIHGTFTAASEESIEYMLSTSHPVHGLARRVFEVYDGSSKFERFSLAHFRRYSERTLAIMLCDMYVEDVAEALARIHETYERENGKAVQS